MADISMLRLRVFIERIDDLSLFNVRVVLVIIGDLIITVTMKCMGMLSLAG